MGNFRGLRFSDIKLRSIGFNGWLSIVAVAVSVFLLVSNLGRVLLNAQSNYDVYLAERAGLNELIAEHDKLQSELEYYESYEYKKLYARDNLQLVEPGERLYRLVGQREYYQPRERQRELVPAESYKDWWLRLF